MDHSISSRCGCIHMLFANRKDLYLSSVLFSMSFTFLACGKQVETLRNFRKHLHIMEGISDTLQKDRCRI